MEKMVGTWGLEPQTSTVSIFTVNNLNPFACLAFPQTSYLTMPQKRPVFGDELVTSFPASVERELFRLALCNSSTVFRKVSLLRVARGSVGVQRGTELEYSY
jgi:hypothetical protein